MPGLRERGSHRDGSAVHGSRCAWVVVRMPPGLSAALTAQVYYQPFPEGSGDRDLPGRPAGDDGAMFATAAVLWWRHGWAVDGWSGRRGRLSPGVPMNPTVDGRRAVRAQTAGCRVGPLPYGVPVRWRCVGFLARSGRCQRGRKSAAALGDGTVAGGCSGGGSVSGKVRVSSFLLMIRNHITVSVLAQPACPASGSGKVGNHGDPFHV